jgi:hypothetical protein
VPTVVRENRIVYYYRVRIEQQNRRLAWRSRGCNMSECRRALTRRRWMALSAGFLAGRGLAAQTNIDEEIGNWAKHAPLSMQFRGDSATQCRAWQNEFSAKLSELLGPYKPPERWQETNERTVELDDHRREELLLRADGYRDLPVYRLTPRGSSSGKRPGILALHGHGDYGYDPVAGIAATPERKSNLAEANYDYGVQLVRRGYVVAIPWRLGFRAELPLVHQVAKRRERKER